MNTQRWTKLFWVCQKKNIFWIVTQLLWLWIEQDSTLTRLKLKAEEFLLKNQFPIMITLLQWKLHESKALFFFTIIQCIIYRKNYINNIYKTFWIITEICFCNSLLALFVISLKKYFEFQTIGIWTLYIVHLPINHLLYANQQFFQEWGFQHLRKLLKDTVAAQKG